MLWNWDDAWLITSIYLTSGKPATVKQVIMTGDWINHAIFLDTEFNNSLRKLISVKFVEIKNQELSATDKFITDYKSSKRKTKYILDQVDKVFDILKSKTIDKEKLHLTPETLFSKDILNNALIEYRTEVEKIKNGL